MGTVKKLAGQTLIYGVSTMVGRFINFLLIPLYTACYNPHEYGVITDLYALVAFLNILLVYGMETSFFNFTREETYTPEKVFATGFNNLLITTCLFWIGGSLFYEPIANVLGYNTHPEYILWFVWIIGFDTLSALPFALLRQQQRPIKFSVIRMANIFINVGLNLYFLLWAPRLFEQNGYAPFFNPSIGLGYIFISGLAASLATLLMLLPDIIKAGIKADAVLRTKMLNYAWPLIFIGLAGMANETFDRAVLKYLSPGDDKLYELGVYGAFYKLSMVMTMFVQAFRLAAEPFFFSQFKQVDSRLLYARIMDYFVMVCTLIFVGTMLFIDDIAALLIRNESYYEHPDGMKVVPILLMANLFLGMFYSISVWYRLTNNTKKGSKLSVMAAILTIALNLIFIPIYGFIAAAWATLAVYVFLAVANYIWGQKYYPVPYNLKKIGRMIVWSLAIYALAEVLKSRDFVHPYIVNAALLLIFAGGLYKIQTQLKTISTNVD